ncbi:MAG: sucrase ferredoxin [Thermomicrobiales bacterium]
MKSASIEHCSAYARAADDDPGGSAQARRRFLIIELPLPWPSLSTDAKGLPAGVKEAIGRGREIDAECGFFFIAPDEQYSVPDRLRVLEFDFGEDPRRSASQRDLLVAPELMADTIDALTQRSPLPDAITVNDDQYRDLMICTHGARDACCATFGFPLYRSLRATARQHPGVRVWRASHFGGHRFAPTMFDFPEGRSWGFLDASTAESILTRGCDVERLRHHYRGWTGHSDPAVQLLERELFVREGWAWLENRQDGRMLERDENGDALSVELIAYRPDGSAIEYRASFERGDNIVTMGACNGETMIIPRRRIHSISSSELAIGVH